MSKQNGDRARFQKNRKRKLHNRQRSRALATGLSKSTNVGACGGGGRAGVPAAETDRAASLAMHDEGSPTRAGE